MARLYYLLTVAGHHLSRYSNRECIKKLDISAAQLGALFILQQQPNLRQSELAHALSCTKGAITSMTEKLYDKNLVKKTSCDDDKRSTRLSLTRYGKEKVKQGKPLVTKLQKKLTTQYTKKEIDVIVRFLKNTIEECP